MGNPLTKDTVSYKSENSHCNKAFMSAVNVTIPLARCLSSFDTLEFILQKVFKIVQKVMVFFLRSVITLEESLCKDVHSGVIARMFQILGKQSEVTLCFLTFPESLLDLNHCQFLWQK